MFKFEVEAIDFLPHLSCNFHLELSAGEGAIISGANGIGKTTLLKRLFSDYHNSYAISMIGQGPLDYFYDRKVFEVRKILMQTRKEMIDDEKLGLIWKELGLTEKEDRPLSALSGGELQSLKLALGLGKRASIFLLDEPFQSLDEHRKSVLLKALDVYRREGASFLVVEHDLKCFSSGWQVRPLQVQDGALIGGGPWTI